MFKPPVYATSKYTMKNKVLYWMDRRFNPPRKIKE